MTPEELAGRIRAGTATDAEQVNLYNQMLPFCRKLANQYNGLLQDPTDERQDLLQEAFLAIMDAARTYEPTAGAAFITWAAFFIRRAYESYIGAQVGRSAAAVQEAHKVRSWAREITAKTGHEPTPAQICAHFELTPEKLLFLYQIGQEKSLQEDLTEDGDTTRLDLLADPQDMEADIIDRLTAEEVRDTLRRFLDDLPEDERRAAYMFYVRGWTDKDSAANMDTTPERFRALREKALRHLRNSRNLRELGRYLPERIGSAAYGRNSRNAWTSSTERAAFLSIRQDEWNDRKDLEYLQKKHESGEF